MNKKIKNTINRQSTLFDDHGRLIPINLKNLARTESRRRYICDQPDLNYEIIYNRFKKTIGVGNVSLEEFESRASRILSDIKNNSRSNNILKGVHVPFLIPKLDKYFDIGEKLGEIFIPAVRNSFEESFPKYIFSNHYKGELDGLLKPSKKSRHNKLIEKLNTETVVGYYFPCISDYSIPAAIEQIKNLPDNFILAGALDTSSAIIGSPSLLFRTEGYPPLLWFAGIYH